MRGTFYNLHHSYMIGLIFFLLELTIYKLDSTNCFSTNWSVFLQTGRKNSTLVQFGEKILQSGPHFSTNWTRVLILLPVCRKFDQFVEKPFVESSL